MIPKISEEPIISSVADNEKWVGLFNYKAQDKRLILSKGSLFSLISIAGPGEFPSQQASKYIWEAIADKFYFTSKGKVVKCLKDAVKAGKERLVTLLKSDKKYAEEGVEMSLISIVIWDHFLYVVIIGDPILQLVRKGNFVDLAKAFDDPNSKAITKFGSGRVEKGDILLISSPQMEDRVEALKEVSQKEFAGELSESVIWKWMLEWFKKESVLFDSDEGVYLLGFDLPEEESKSEAANVGVAGDVEGSKSDKSKEVDENAGKGVGKGIGKDVAKKGIAAAIGAGFGAAVSKFKSIEGGAVVGSAKKAVDGVKKGAENVATKVSEVTGSADKDQQISMDNAAMDDVTENADVEVKNADDKGVEVEQTEQDIQSKNLPSKTEKPSTPLSFHERKMLLDSEDVVEEKNKDNQGNDQIVSQQTVASDASAELQTAASTLSETPIVDKPEESTSQKKSFIEKSALPEKIKDFSRKAGAFFSKIKLGGGEKKIFVGKNNVSLARYAVIGVVVLLLGFLLVKRISDNRRLADLREEYDTQVTDLGKKVSQAEDLVSTDPETARTELVKSLEKVDKIAKIEYPENKSSEWRSKVQNLIDGIDKMTGISEKSDNFEILLDAFAQYGEKSHFQDMALTGDILYLTDTENSSVYTFNVITKSTGKISDPDDTFQEPKWLETSQNGNVFVYDKKQGVIKYEPDSGDMKVLTGLTPRILGNVTEFSVYGEEEKLYFLDSKSAKVYKSQIIGAGYSAPEEYILFGGLDKSNDLAIDGNIFVSTRTQNKIYKFFSGVQDRLDIKGLYDPLGVTGGIFIKPGFLNIYITDVEKNRIVVLETPDNDRHRGQATVVKQYEYRGSRKEVFESLVEIVVDSDKEFMYVLENDLVYRITI